MEEKDIVQILDVVRDLLTKPDVKVKIQCAIKRITKPRDTFEKYAAGKGRRMTIEIPYDEGEYMSGPIETLGDAYPKLQAKIRQCLINGKAIGPAGMFYCVMAEDLLKRADKAAIEQDIVAMVQIAQEMQEFGE